MTDILIVDDETDIRSLLSLTLEDEGFSTVQAANAEQARDIVSKSLPSCAILDIWMRDSDMDGLELLTWCKAIYPDMPKALNGVEHLLPNLTGLPDVIFSLR